MNNAAPSPGDTYASLLTDLKEKIRGARLKVAAVINQELVLLYWSIGRDILARQTVEGWERGSSIGLPQTFGATFRT